MPDGDAIGSAYVKILPDTAGFASALLVGTQGGFDSLNKSFLLLGAAAIGAGGYAVTMAVQFQTALSQIAGRMGITTQAANAIGDAFLSTAGTATFSANTIAAAFLPVSGQLDQLNGKVLTSGQALAFMQTAMKLAEASGQPLATVTAALTSVIQAYGLGLAGANDASAILYNASVALGDPIDSLATVVDRLHGKLGDATPPLSQVAALMLELQANGVQARLAVTDVSGAFGALIDPTAAAKKEIGDLHLEVTNSHGAFVGMDSIIAQLRPKFEAMTQAQQLQTAALIFGKAPADAMLSVILKGPAAFDATTESLKRQVPKITGLQTDWDILTSSVSDLATKIGTDLLPKLSDFVSWITQNLSWITKLVEAVGFFYTLKKGISIFKSLESDASSLIGKLGGLLGAQASPASGVTGAVTAVDGVRVFVTNWAMMGGSGAGTGVSPVGAVGAGAAVGTEGAGAALTGTAGAAAEISGTSGVGLGVGAFLVINGITEQLLKTQVSAFNTAASAKTVSDAYDAFSGILKGGKFFTYASGQQEALHVLSQALDAAGLHGGNVATAISQVEGFMKTGQISAKNAAVDMQTFVSLWDAGVRNTKQQGAVLDIVNSYIKKYGPLTVTQVEALEGNIAHGQDSAFEIYLSLKTANENLQSLPASAKGLAGALAALVKAIPGVTRLIGGDLGALKATAGGGFFDTPTPLLVGESGPEVVLNRSQFQAMMSGAPSSKGRVVQIVQNFYNNTTKEFKQEIEANNGRLMTALRSI